MGQKFRAIVDETVIIPTGNAELKEHYWLSNPFVNYVCSLLNEDFHRVTWMGTRYGEDNSNICEGAEHVSPEVRQHMLGLDTGVLISPYGENEHQMDFTVMVNRDRKELLCIETYRALCWQQRGILEKWFIHPLPLLTMIGTTSGDNPDYFGKNSHYCGRWANQQIGIFPSSELNRLFGEGYVEILPIFIEEYEDPSNAPNPYRRRPVHVTLHSKQGFYIGDPCYTDSDVVSRLQYGSGYCGLFHDAETGMEFADGGTYYGDGGYKGSDGHTYNVDSGTIGVVPLELIDPSRFDSLKDDGKIVKRPGTAEFISDDGVFTIRLPNGKEIVIDTSPHRMNTKNYGKNL